MWWTSFSNINRFKFLSINFFYIENDELYSVGRNVLGQLGIGESKDKNTPQLVSFFKQMKIKKIYSGASQSLVLTGKNWFLFEFSNDLDNDEIYSFGSNNCGQLGIGNEINQFQPQLISFFKNKKINFISCGNFHTFVSTGKRNIRN